MIPSSFTLLILPLQGKIVVSIVGYRDFGPNGQSPRYEVLPFTEVTADIETFLNELSGKVDI